MVTAATAAAALSLAAWLYLAFFHGRFWRADQRLPAPSPAPALWPAVIAVVPARDEAALIARALRSLFEQDYPGGLSVVLADDASRDGTAQAAYEAVAGAAADGAFTVVRVPERPEGWTGKLWALECGIAAADRLAPEAPYLLLTDADIAHGPTSLRRLVGHAEAAELDLASLMVMLECGTPWERLLLPAFVFFFQMLYPFPLVNRRASRLAGAAGGVMLVRRSALQRVGGMAPIKGALIDDCALARRIKRAGPIWLGLAEDSRSIRPYGGLGGVWHMVRRTAYAQLGHSALALAGTVVGMVVVYLVPPVAALGGLAAGAGEVAALGALAWATMAALYQPTLRLYDQPAVAALLLPIAGVVYTLITLDSARRHRRGKGGDWKGRSYPG